MSTAFKMSPLTTGSVVQKREESGRLQAKIAQYERQMEENKHFTVVMGEPCTIQVELDPGQYVLHCLICNTKCHFPCEHGDTSDAKRNCPVMYNGYCCVCPETCHWAKHYSSRYCMETGTKKVTRTREDMKKAYFGALQEKLTAEESLNRLQKEVENTH
ncbi:uncharacterized protein LOC129586096 [Paramacrobiotus metropolitanus]|uniref:uncharacterized protein LOC129586096 n=1 Tax=Paramacrobiotus metropolitanus TaxID=2943436 RepID=UPI002446113A|nr:uncharacterized protein LOC129586096 [Paramacrobiotus metropolitanus]